MVTIDPQKLLVALKSLLADNGGIKGANEASKIAALMKDASKLVSRCIYLNILRATKSSDAIDKFIDVGGWEILNKWLDASRSENNDPLLGEILEVYQKLPVTVSLLKKTSAAKTIKHLSKSENEKIKSLSSNIVDVWTKTIRNNKDKDDAETKEKQKKKENGRERNKEDEDRKRSERDKERSERDKENDKKREGKRVDVHKSSDGKDRHRDKDRKDRDRHRGRDHDEKSRHKDSKSKSTSDRPSSKPSSSTHPSSSKPKDNSLKKITPPEEAKASSAPSDNKADENKLRPKTVKRITNNFRSTGLFDEDDDESEQKKTEKQSSKRSSVDPVNEETSDKKPRLQLSMPTLTPANLDPPVSTTPPEVQHGRIKIIPAPAKKPGTHGIEESNVFMNALQSTTYSGSIKRKKKVPSVSTPSPSPLSTPSLLPSINSPAVTSTPTTPVGEKNPQSPPILSPTTAQIQKLPSVPSFYRDTLEDAPDVKEDKIEYAGERERESTPPIIEAMMDTSPPLLPPQTEQADISKAPEGNPAESKEPNETTDKVPEDTEPKRKRKNKKVSWARESYLEEYFYFELDETERENVNRPKSFLEMKREEMMLDKRAMESARRTSNDFQEPVLPWRRPKLIDDVIVVVESGKESTQREVQSERERAVLCALYFNKIPDTPKEPDPEIPLEDEEMKLIPLEDDNHEDVSDEETGACTEYEHTYNFEDPSSLPYDPEFGVTVPGGAPPTHPSQMNNNGTMGNLNMAEGGFNLPPALNQLLNTLRQQAQETRDPIMQNLQGRLTMVLQNTPPQDSGMLMDRILQALEPFKNQIPGLSNLIGSLMSNGMEPNMGNGMGPRGMPPVGPNQMGNPPRHGLLGSGPPGFNMMGPGSMRPNMSGPPGPGSNIPGGPPPDFIGNGSGNMNQSNFYERGYPGGGPGPRHSMGDMRRGGAPWRGGRGGKMRGNKRRHIPCEHFAKGHCHFGRDCTFAHVSSHDVYS